MAAAVLPIVAEVAGLLGGDTKDPQRLAQNQAWYNAAIQGDALALADLKAAAGNGTAPRDPASTAGSGGDIGGWATATAEQDAANKYNQAVQALKQGTSTGSAVSPALASVLTTATGGGSILPLLLILAAAGGLAYVVLKTK